MTLYDLDLSQLASADRLPHWASLNGEPGFEKQHILEYAPRIGLGEKAIEEKDIECKTLS
jgi:hypothetical protein